MKVALNIIYKAKQDHDENVMIFFYDYTLKNKSVLRRFFKTPLLPVFETLFQDAFRIRRFFLNKNKPSPNHLVHSGYYVIIDEPNNQNFVLIPNL